MLQNLSSAAVMIGALRVMLAPNLKGNNKMLFLALKLSLFLFMDEENNLKCY